MQRSQKSSRILERVQKSNARRCSTGSSRSKFSNMSEIERPEMQCIVFKIKMKIKPFNSTVSLQLITDYVAEAQGCVVLCSMSSQDDFECSQNSNLDEDQMQELEASAIPTSNLP